MNRMYFKLNLNSRESEKIKHEWDCIKPPKPKCTEEWLAKAKESQERLNKRAMPSIRR